MGVDDAGAADGAVAGEDDGVRGAECAEFSEGGDPAACGDAGGGVEVRVEAVEDEVAGVDDAVVVDADDDIVVGVGGAGEVMEEDGRVADLDLVLVGGHEFGGAPVGGVHAGEPGGEFAGFVEDEALGGAVEGADEAGAAGDAADVLLHVVEDAWLGLLVGDDGDAGGVEGVVAAGVVAVVVGVDGVAEFDAVALRLAEQGLADGGELGVAEEALALGEDEQGVAAGGGVGDGVDAGGEFLPGEEGAGVWGAGVAGGEGGPGDQEEPGGEPGSGEDGVAAGHGGGGWGHLGLLGVGAAGGRRDSIPPASDDHSTRDEREIPLKVNDLRPGTAVSMNGKLYVVMKTDHVKPGKGPAYVQAKMRAIDGSGTAEKRFNSSDSVEGANLDRREIEFLYADGAGGGTFMDTESFEQIEMGKDILGDALLYLAPNATCTVLVHDERPVLVELPAAVEVTVTDTPPGIKGATATNQLKEAECDTGLKTRVPPFITTGEKIKVSTEDGSYISRV